MYKEIKVLMLPTNEKSVIGNIGLNEADNSLQIMQRKWLGNKFFETKDGSPVHGIVIPQHLYFLSDEKIKEGYKGYAIAILKSDDRIKELKIIGMGK